MIQQITHESLAIQKIDYSSYVWRWKEIWTDLFQVFCYPYNTSYLHSLEAWFNQESCIHFEYEIRTPQTRQTPVIEYIFIDCVCSCVWHCWNTRCHSYCKMWACCSFIKIWAMSCACPNWHFTTCWWAASYWQEHELIPRSSSAWSGRSLSLQHSFPTLLTFRE